MYDDQSRERMEREEYARSHPLRARILALYAVDEHRSLAAADLLGELDEENTSYSAVAYHVRILRDVGLLPKADD
jgi:DNA-binding transcriptional ArsR family regulator